MAGFLPDARLIDLIVALVALEAGALVAARMLGGYGPPVVGTLSNCAAGACLLLAVRAVMTGAASPTVALLLGASLAAHLADLAARWTADAHKLPHLPASCESEQDRSARQETSRSACKPS